MNQILKNKFNAWGFFIVACVWVVLMILELMFSVLEINIGIMYPITRMLLIGTGMVMTFLFFSISRSEPGLAAVGLILGIIGLISQTALMSELSSVTGSFIGISYIFFAFAILKQNNRAASWLGWAMILSSIIGLASIGMIAGMINGGFGGMTIFSAITTLFGIFVALAAIYYIIVEGSLFESTGAPKTINTPENLN